MKRKISYALLLTGILLIGFVIGFLVSGRMIKSKVDDMRSYYTPTGFNHHIVRVLHPTDEQLETIKPILLKYAELNEEMMWECKQSQRQLFLEMNEELKPWLDDDQINRLKRLPTERFLKNRQEESTTDRKYKNRTRGQGKHRRVND